MWKKIRVKARTKFYQTLVKLSLMAGRPQLTARALAFLAGRIERGSNHTVLVLGRSVFYDDILAMAEYGRQLNYALIHLTYWEIIFAHLVKRAGCKGLTEANYHASELCREGKRRYHSYLLKLFPHLRRYLKIDAVISGNIGYVVQQELARVSAEAQVPFVVLHKEAMDVYGGLLEAYRNYKFLGAKVLFYNARIRDELVKRVDGLAIEKTAVVGIPRFDFYFKGLRKPEAKQVAFFCFFPNDKFLATIQNEEMLKRAKRAYAAFHKLVMDFAAKHSDFRVTMKTKTARHYLNYVLDIYKANYSIPLDNLTITNSAKASDLIQDSAAVMGFDSTVLIEAVAAGRPIICPDFRDFATDRSWDFLAGFEDLVNYVKTKADLEKFLTEKVAYPAPELRNRFLHQLIGQTDGRASLKAEQEIIKAINEGSRT